MFKHKIENSIFTLCRSVLMVLVMSGTLSFYWTGINIDTPSPNTLVELTLSWLQAWGESFLIALPISLIVGPWINRYVKRES
ncbi:DUF2798 domain-containing protein [Aliiglaciecola sp. M165]|uniref:DUF2798 domain-containing protein n=1 Tax=Aliiglaciecola sp. M165 TaxID=2593649 RepID=UPI00163DBA80|nr:DUF2798 domain-containing protein [Aliiglaciecola sp. M165]